MGDNRSEGKIEIGPERETNRAKYYSNRRRKDLSCKPGFDLFRYNIKLLKKEKRQGVLPAQMNGRSFVQFASTSLPLNWTL